MATMLGAGHFFVQIPYLAAGQYSLSDKRQRMMRTNMKTSGKANKHQNT